MPIQSIIGCAFTELDPSGYEHFTAIKIAITAKTPGDFIPLSKRLHWQ
jgi:hypothetical protein